MWRDKMKYLLSCNGQFFAGFKPTLHREISTPTFSEMTAYLVDERDLETCLEDLTKCNCTVIKTPIDIGAEPATVSLNESVAQALENNPLTDAAFVVEEGLRHIRDIEIQFDDFMDGTSLGHEYQKAARLVKAVAIETCRQFDAKIREREIEELQMLATTGSLTASEKEHVIELLQNFKK